MLKIAMMRAISQMTGKPSLTSDYLFDRAYAAHRSGVVLGGHGRLSILSYLLRNLSRDERESLFPGQFDIGSFQQPSKLTTAALIEEIRAEGHGEAAESIRIIKERIKNLTGVHFTKFFDQNRWGALKIVKLLYILKSKSSVRIFSLLALPGHKCKPSMEVRDTYPLIGNEKAANLISDLKAFLSLEIAPIRLREIDETFGSLLDRVNGISRELVQSMVLACGSEYSILLRLLDSHLKQFAVFNDVEMPKPEMPLAEMLYIHCYAMEFLHFTKATRFIAANLMPKLAIVAIGSELRQLSRSIQDRQQVSTNDQCIPMSNFTNFVLRYRQDIYSALTNAMGDSLVPKDIQKVTLYAEKLIRLWAFFIHPRGALTVIEDFEVTPIMALAAMAAIWYELAQPTSYYPYWLGQEYARGNVISALEKVNLHSSNMYVPEEYNVFWHRRLEWFRFALAGQLDFLERKEKIEEYLVMGFEHLVESYNITAVRNHIDSYTGYPAKFQNG